MCGICGELRLDGGVPDLSHIGRMMELLARRGPDHDGSHSDGPVALGHRRLSIIDLSNRSNQPLVDEELGLVLVFNGTIYNYPELREQLTARGYRFFTGGDSEVILKAYAEWGADCPQYLHGMFALAIWDTRRQSLFLARDRFGITSATIADATAHSPPTPMARRASSCFSIAASSTRVNPRRRTAPITACGSRNNRPIASIPVAASRFSPLRQRS